EDTAFSHDRGFYEAPFALEITTATADAKVRYTLDGTKPSSSHGIVYSGPISISATTTLRAVATKPNFRSSNVDTHTYLFLDQVLQQPTNPPGFPSNWNSSIEGSQQSEYEMDPEVVGPLYSEAEVKVGLRSLPTVCLTTEVDDLFGSDNGIYINAQQRGDSWEREISMEFFDFSHGKDLQVDAGLRMNGNFSRSKIQPKHNMRVVFREDYGPSRLEFKLFEDGKVTRFNSLILRGLSGDSWAHARYPHAQYIRDQWFRDAYESMGYEGIHQREIQLYINGLYWGVYHIFERVEDDSMAERFGGIEEDWEVIKDGSNSSVLSVDGGTARWDALMDVILAGNLSESGPYLALQEYLDIDAFIDYLLLNYYGGNDDWCSKNYRAAVQLNPPGKYKFFPHDTERAGYNALRNAGLNKDSTTINNIYRPTHVHHELTANAEYRLRFADRAHRFLFNGGALTEGPAGKLWSDKADFIRDALKAECARWGDFTQDERGASKINTLTEWQALVDREMMVWFPQRSEILTNQLRADALYPDLDAPAFSQHGGKVPGGFQLLFTNAGADNIYYTTDGSDPRLAGGEINPLAASATSESTRESLITDNSPGWEYLDDGSDQGTSEIVSGHPDYDVDHWKHPDFSPLVAWETGTARLGYSANENTTIGYGPDIRNKFPTTYFRKSFEVTDAALFSSLLLEVERDDGVIVYLNGHEVIRDNITNGIIEFDDHAIEGVGTSGETTFYPFNVEASRLNEGTNVLAIELHQRSLTSSDTSIDVRLSGTKVAEGTAIPIIGQIEVKARSYDAATQTWSALTAADFSTGRPPKPGDLTVSEIYYHPSAPSATEIAQPFITSGSDFEFIELINISPDPLDLSGLSFTQGIDFSFPENFPFLGQGERVLIANNRKALEFRYGHLLTLPIGGEFGSTSGLSNGGEQLVLNSVFDFTYDDLAPWPVASDGIGYSLVLIDPLSNPDLSNPVNWRSSIEIGGIPGSDDATTLAEFSVENGIANPFLDHDGDGIATIIEYATGSPYDIFSVENLLNFHLENDPVDPRFVIEFFIAPGADDILLAPELSLDLSTWERLPDTSYLGEIRQPDGRILRRFQTDRVISNLSSRFFRLRATQR
ncbi:MAG: chitobiase/beta-hexosaminidase C-terminal domain-containing protein, partial [Akkermansiaceae bacterium]